MKKINQIPEAFIFRHYWFFLLIVGFSCSYGISNSPNLIIGLCKWAIPALLGLGVFSIAFAGAIRKECIEKKTHLDAAACWGMSSLFIYFLIGTVFNTLKYLSSDKALYLYEKFTYSLIGGFISIGIFHLSITAISKSFDGFLIRFKTIPKPFK